MRPDQRRKGKVLDVSIPINEAYGDEIVDGGEYFISGCSKNAKPMATRYLSIPLNSRAGGNLPESKIYVEDKHKEIDVTATKDILFDVLLHRAVSDGKIPLENAGYPTPDTLDNLRIIVAAQQCYDTDKELWKSEISQAVLSRCDAPKLWNRKVQCLVSPDNLVEMSLWLQEHVGIENNRNCDVWVCAIDTDLKNLALDQLRIQLPLTLRDFRARLYCMEQKPHTHDLLIRSDTVGCRGNV